MAVSITRTANPDSAGSGTTITYSGVSTGTAAPSRVVVVCVGTELSSGTPSSATIGGVAMNAGTLGSLGAIGARIFWKHWPDGTTADIAVTFGASQGSTTHHLCVYAVTGASATASSESAVGDTDADPISSGAITIPTNGGCIAVCSMAADTTARTWTGITEDLDEDFNAGAGTFRFTTGTSTTSGTPTITVSGANNEDGALAWLVLKPGITITIGAGSYAVTGTNASINKGLKLTADAGSYALTGTDASISKGQRLIIDAGSYNLAGTDASIEHGWVLSAGAGSYAISGTDASVEHGWVLVADAGSYDITGSAASISKGLELIADAGSYTIIGTDSALLHAWALATEAGSYSIAGIDAATEHGFALAANSGSYTINGIEASIVAGSNKILPAEAGSYELTGTAASLEYGRSVQVSLGSYDVSGADVTVALLRQVIALSEIYLLSGSSASLSIGTGACQIPAWGASWLNSWGDSWGCVVADSPEPNPICDLNAVMTAGTPDLSHSVGSIALAASYGSITIDADCH